MTQGMHSTLLAVLQAQTLSWMVSILPGGPIAEEGRLQMYTASFSLKIYFNTDLGGFH